MSAIKLLSRQIAEVIFESGSCKTACGESPNVDAMLKREMIERMITQIKNNEGRRVQFKPGWFGAPSVNCLAIRAAPTDSIVSSINEKLKPIFRDHMSQICAADCSVEVLTSVVQSIIDEIGYAKFVNDTFEAKSSSGGRRHSFRRRRCRRRRCGSTRRRQ